MIKVNNKFEIADRVKVKHTNNNVIFLIQEITSQTCPAGTQIHYNLITLVKATDKFGIRKGDYGYEPIGQKDQIIRNECLLEKYVEPEVKPVEFKEKL